MSLTNPIAGAWVTAPPRSLAGSAHAVTLVPGDWIGPELCDVARAVVEGTGVRVRWEVFHLPDGTVTAELLESARRTGVVLKSRLGAGRKPGHLPASVELRQRLGLWGQLRHVHNLPGVPARFQGVDVVVVRETSEDIFTGLEHEPAEGVFESVKLTTEAACERIARFAFEGARRWGRRRVTVVHKANILKKADGLFLRTALRVAAEYPDVACDDVIVDALCMKLVRWPERFDILLCGNLFGDIVADLVTGVAGGVSVAGATTFGGEVVMFENPHGKAPWLVGTGRANPVPMVVQGIHLLAFLGEEQAARRLGEALHGALADGELRTEDMGGTTTTTQARDAILARL